MPRCSPSSSPLQSRADVTAPDLHPARRFWQLLELLHVVTYFSPEPRAALKAIGVRQFWPGYFGARSAPMGAVGTAVVDATFYNFAPRLIGAAIPSVWEVASPDALLGARAEGAAAALRRLVPSVDAEAPRIVPLLSSVVRSARCQGRVLAAANQALALPDDPVAALWQCATTLREHRGDGHLAILVALEVGGLEAHVLRAAAGELSADLIKSSRGWSDEEWDAAVVRLGSRGVLDEDGGLNDDGRSLCAEIETRTDEVAEQPYLDGLTPEGLALLPSLLRPLAAAVAASGEIPLPNPIGFDPASAVDG